MLRTRPRKIPRDLLLDPPPSRTRWLWIIISGSLFCLLVMATAVIADDGLTPDASYFTSSDGERMSAVPLSTTYELQVNGIVVTSEVTQVFRNERDTWLDLTYVLPLPDEAAVNHLVIQVEDRVITGVMQRRHKARATFEQARAEGRSAALIEQARSNLFEQSVANIAPGAEVVVRLRFLTTVRMQDGRFTLRLPLTLTPRYGGGTPESSGFMLASSPKPVHKARVKVNLDAGIGLAELLSPSHDLGTERVGHRWRIEVREGTRALVPTDRDVVLHWRPALTADPLVAAFRETVDGYHHLLLLVFPPEHDVDSLLPRELMYIVDTSGSMKGQSIVQAKQAVVEAIGSLRPQDRFNVIAFSDRHVRLFPAFEHPAPDTLLQAQRFIAGLTAGGGTEMQAPLFEAMTMPHEDHWLRQLVFMTDGAVSYEDRLLAQIGSHIGRARLHTLGIGAAPNSYFMRKAAEFGGGSYNYVSSPSEVASTMQALDQKLSAPAVSDLTISSNASEPLAMYPDQVSTLFANDSLVLSARTETIPETLRISGRTAAGPWEREVDLTTLLGKEHRGVASLWARARMEDLMDQKISSRGEEKTAVVEQITQLALSHSLMSPYTSFVAVDRKVSRFPGEDVSQLALANTRPGTAAPAQVAWPRTATGWQRQFAVGVMVLAMALTLLAATRIVVRP